MKTVIFSSALLNTSRLMAARLRWGCGPSIAIKTNRLKPNDAMRLLDDYERLLQEYTYLSLNGVKLPPQSGSWLPLS